MTATMSDEIGSGPETFRAVLPEPCEAAHQLRSVLHTAGVRTRVDTIDGEPLSPIQLGAIDGRGALELASLIRDDLQPLFEGATALREALEAHGLELPELDVYDGRVRLGKIEIDTAAHLAHVLGAPPREPTTDIVDWPVGQELVNELLKATASATDGCDLDIYFHPYCAHCETDPSVDLGSIPLPVAQRLTSALHPQDQPVCVPLLEARDAASDTMAGISGC